MMPRARTLCWLALALTLIAGRAALAQDTVQDIDCDDFVTRQAAQALLDADPAYAEVLDEDGDGLACETLPTTQGGDSVRIATSVPTSQPMASPTPTEEAATPSTPVPAEDIDVEAALEGRLGGSREAFEAENGTPLDDDSDDLAASTFYVVPGFASVEVAYHEDFIRAMVLDLTAPVDVESATDVVAPFLPADFVLQDTIVDPENGNVLSIGTSPALGVRFSAETYDVYEASGEPGDLFYQFRLNDDGLVVAIDIALGNSLPGDDSEVRATPVDAAPPTVAADASAYLETTKAQYDAVIASMGVFAALIGAPPAQPEESYQDALLAEAAIWQQAYEGASEVTPPAELEELHTSYLAFLSLMNEAAENITAGINDDDPELIDEGISRVIEATALIEDLDRAFANAET
jgi:hypothetical protein